MPNTYLQRNMANSLTTDWTVSMWVKRTEIVRQQTLFSAYNNSTHDTEVFFDGDKLNFRNKRSGSFVFQVKTNRLFRDVNAWYHLVFQFHASGDSGVYAKIFVNGVQETDLNVNTQGSGATTWNNDKSHSIGALVNGAADHFSGLISHMHFASTGIYAPTVFGETDATTGEWKIITSPTFTLGSNGFTILKDGNTITDQSTNSNDFSLGSGTLTNTEDCPSDIFATLNVLEKLGSSITVSNGNTQFFNQSSAIRGMVSNLALPNTGKFYAEMKVDEVSSAVQTGIMSQSYFWGAEESQLGQQGQYNSYGYKNNGEKISNSSSSSYGNSFAGGIIGIAVDMDNKNIYFSKDGVWQNSGDPTSGATGTGAAFTDLQNNKYYCFAVSSQGSNPKVSWNFGNGYFATTAVSSAGTNASGIGIFEYNVPTGFTALSTKGLNE